MLDAESYFYFSHQDELVKEYNGKHIVIALLINRK